VVDRDQILSLNVVRSLNVDRQAGCVEKIENPAGALSTFNQTAD